MSRATLNGLEVHHEVQGEGPAIVFVHGLGATSNVRHARRTLLPTLAPFRSNDWPWKTDPSKSTGPARLAGVP